MEHKSGAELLNRKRLRQAHAFTLLLRISLHSNRESSDVALVRISEKVKQCDNFVYAITKYVSLPLTLKAVIDLPNRTETGSGFSGLVRSVCRIRIQFHET